MRHKWERQPDYSMVGIGIFKIWICKICKCKKQLHNARFAEPTYTRSQMNYDHYIECIDEEFEKTKTID